MSLITLDIAEGIATVTFVNPPRGYLNAAQAQELEQAADELAADSRVRAVIFTGGVPGVFIRHYDVAEIVQFAAVVRSSDLDDEALMEQARAGSVVSNAFDKVDRLPKPTIAAINGYCQGGGFEFALCCDLRIAEAGNYPIGLPETNVGIFPGAGGTERLPRLIGEARAIELILRGRTVCPDEALSLGMVHEVTHIPVLDRAREIAREFTVKPAGGLAAAKALVKTGGDLGLADACAIARGRFSRLIADDSDADAAMRRFLAEGENINTSLNQA